MTVPVPQPTSTTDAHCSLASQCATKDYKLMTRNLLAKSNGKSSTSHPTPLKETPQDKTTTKTKSSKSEEKEITDRWMGSEIEKNNIKKSLMYAQLALIRQQRRQLARSAPNWSNIL